MRFVYVFFVLLVAVAAASADPSNLEDGVFIAHYASSLQFSSSPPPEGWCQHYLNHFPINSCDGQLNRIDTGDGSIWFVLAAWQNDKEWCGVEFGLAEYDEASYLITAHAGCFPEGGLEIASVGWPGPNEGTTLVVTGLPWQGNFVPVYFFAGYAYHEGIIPLASNPVSGFGGTANCGAVPTKWSAAQFGAIGLFTDGQYVCPTGIGPPGPIACCIGEDCHLLSPSTCIDLGGVPHFELDSCEPDPCQSPSPVLERNWGRIKWDYR
ncbi:MAG: hypothetical protein KAY24_08545 [Candidatus Eisenbacteria sp.]|nr:hypothetical protein [Candidatus Eisenbacteria bacterium]